MSEDHKSDHVNLSVIGSSSYVKRTSGTVGRVSQIYVSMARARYTDDSSAMDRLFCRLIQSNINDPSTNQPVPENTQWIEHSSSLIQAHRQATHATVK